MTFGWHASCSLGHTEESFMNPYLLLVPLSLASGSTVLFLLLDRIRRTHFTEEA
jgi:hypothetical protein